MIEQVKQSERQLTDGEYDQVIEVMFQLMLSSNLDELILILDQLHPADGFSAIGSLSALRASFLEKQRQARNIDGQATYRAVMLLIS